jgi:hypothetical protein
LDRKLVAVTFIIAVVLPFFLFFLASYTGYPYLAWFYNGYGGVDSVAISSDGSFVAAGLETGSQSGRLLLFNRSSSLIWSRDPGRVTYSVGMNEAIPYPMAPH